LQACFEKVSGCFDGIQNRPCEGLLADPGGQVEDEGHIFAGCPAIFAGQEITFEQIDSRSRRSTVYDSSDSAQFAGGSNKTHQITESAIEQALQYSRSYETGGSSYQNPLIRAYREAVL
jgi:hypothetical protein